MKETIKEMRIAELKPAPYNPRAISPEALAGLKESIKRFGLVQPIVWNKKTKRVVSGHQRLKAMAAIGEKKALVVVVDWPELKEQEANLAFNNQAIAGEFTDDVAALLDRIEREDKDAFEALRLNEIEIPEDESEAKAVDDTPSPPSGESRRNTLEVWELGRHRLICGSCTDPVIVEKVMAGRKAQCVFTDPPYGVDYEARSGKFTKIKGDDKTGDDLAQKLILPALKHAVAVAHNNAGFYIWHASGTRDDFSFAMKQAGLQERQYIIWAKPAAVMGWGDYRWAHEPCFYAGKAGEEPAFFGDRTNQTMWRIGCHGRLEQATSLSPGLIIRDGKGQSITITPGESQRKFRAIRLERGQSLNFPMHVATADLWEVSRDGKADHPTQKPVELARRAIQNSTEEGDVVYDPFMGSGSTLIGAEITDRRAVGCELERKYCLVIVERWEKLTGEKAKLS